jgi:hypothetical protein
LGIGIADSLVIHIDGENLLMGSKDRTQV